MEGDGATASSDSTYSGDGELTTTGNSGIPTAPVYGGAMVPYNFSPVLRTRKREFLSEQFYKKPDYGTDTPSPFVPKTAGPRGGIDVQRHMAGVGIPYADPLDLFKPAGVDIDKKPQGVRRPSRPVDTSRQRQRGTAAYRKVNKENVDSGGAY
jgi:hypothetical protein